jgi:DNA modification methylase
LTLQTELAQIEMVAIDGLSLMPRDIVPVVYTERDLAVVEHLLKENGQPLPVLVQQSTNRIFWGGDIWLKLRDSGATHIAAIIRDVDDREAARIAIRLRRASELAEWSQKELAEILAQMEDFETMGFDEGEFEALLAEVAPPVTTNDAPDPGESAGDILLAQLLEKWGVANGQLWQIPSKSIPGRSHRLLCGDSTNADDVRRLMAGQRATLFATDPPYLVNYDGLNHPGGKSRDWSETYHDWDGDEKGEQFYHAFIGVAIREAITDHAAWYCWHASARQAMLERVWKEHGVLLHQQIFWNKNRGVLTRSWYLWKHEPCFFGWIEGNKPTRIANDVPPTVWDADVPSSQQVGEVQVHPTSKPTVLFEIPMLQHVEPGGLCYEPFSGSGSQHVAGEKLGRIVFGLEKEPAYVAGILERLKGLGLEPKLVEVQPANS